MGTVDAVTVELERLGATETVEGQIALRLAEQLDRPRAAMAPAGDARELRAVMVAIREKTPVKADPLDELRARRERDAAGGSAPKAV